MAACLSPRERLTRALRGDAVDRLPITADITYWNSARQLQGRWESRWDGVEGYLRQHEELGVVPCFDYSVFSGCRQVWDGATCDTVQTARECRVVWRVGDRQLTRVDHFLPESWCWGVAEYPVKDADDLATLLVLLDHLRLEPDLGRHRARQAEWGDRGLCALGPPRSPLPALLTEWAGVVTSCYLLMDCPELVREYVARMNAIQDPVYTAYAAYRPVCVEFADNISGENIGGLWDEWLAPTYRRRLAELHDAGIVVAIHNDGTLRGALDNIAATGFDAAEALTPAPVGDVPCTGLRELVGRDDFVLWGMLPGAMFAPQCSDAAFHAHVDGILENVTAPLILGTADQVPPDGDLQRLRWVADRLG